MNRFDIINRIGDKYRVGNTETGEFSYAQALKTVGKDIKDYQKATTGTQHKFLDILWGDRIFEKCGIRRDEGGDDGKTLEIRGKRRLSARDGGANYQQS